VQMKQLCVSYDGRPILDQIKWTIQAGECWQLKGPNGSGKSTLLSMITGDNPKGYGQDLNLFGMKKGSGETVWDIKQYIGYFNPVMIQHFSRLDSIELMIVSGCMDSIGVYIKPSEMQLRLAKEWLDYLGLLALKNKPIQFLPAAQQRMVLIARAMVKHPPLLILDEPTSGLDDASAAMVIGMIEQIRKETKTSVLFVSHQQEKGFEPDKTFELTASATGSTGAIV
jgi:molybdate transport system ATP-binding protein